MEKYLVSFLTAFTCFSVAAQSKTPEDTLLETATYRTVCMNAVNFTKLIDEFEELPFARGHSYGMFDNSILSMVVFVNPKTKSFTIAEKSSEDLYCILTLGREFEPMPKGIVDGVLEGRQKGKL